MKLERISENQIRCTLTRSDLAERELKLSELAYGTEKAKELFKEMMMQASDELGFEADNIPLIIEAVPISNECIMLIVTKVEDPEELDTRFSRFTPFSEDDDNSEASDDMIYSGAEEILDIFKRLSNDIIAKGISGNKQTEDTTDTDSNDIALHDNLAETEDTAVLIRIYEFHHLDDVSRLSELLPEDLECGNTLYKNPQNQHFYLVLSNEGISSSDFTSICRLASEFGSAEKASANTLYYYDEHYETFIRENALQILRSL